MPKTTISPGALLENTPFNLHYDNMTVKQQRSLKEFVKDKLEKKSPNTLRNWLKGKTHPTAAEKDLLAKHLKTQVGKLFITE